MQQIIDNKRGWLTGLVVFALMVMTPFHDPQIALASDYAEDLQWNQNDTAVLLNDSWQWHLDQLSDRSSEQNDLMINNEESNIPAVVEADEPAVTESPAVAAEAEAAPVKEVAETFQKGPVIHQRKEIPKPTWRINITAEQMSLLERCVMAEGGGESYECQVAIACVIINRVLSDKYPDTIDGVIKQEGQFSTWPRMIERVTPTDEVKQAVREALANEVIPENVLYFRAGRYHRWANRYCRIDGTYFSTP